MEISLQVRRDADPEVSDRVRAFTWFTIQGIRHFIILVLPLPTTNTVVFSG